MRLDDRSVDFVVNFLLGVSWAAVFLGVVSTFVSFYSYSFLFAVISSVMASLPGMTGVLLIEHFITSKEQYSELRKQTQILEQILQKEQKNQ